MAAADGKMTFNPLDDSRIPHCVFIGGCGRTDFPGGDFDSLLAGIRQKLFTLPDDTRLLPGHGPADFTPWLRALANINYPGCVNAFMHGHVEADAMSAALAKSRDYLKQCARS